MVWLKRILIYLLLLLASIPAVFLLLGPGFYEPHDLHHLADIYQAFRAFESGQIPPRLGPDFTFGYGYPLFNFYYVLPFYLGAFWFYLFGSLAASFKFVFILGALISVLGMYLFLRELVGKGAAAVGSILYLYTPYRAVEIYVRGAIGEALAISLLPLVFWGAIRVVKDKSPKTVAIFSLIIFAFIISHNYLFVLAAPWLFLFILILLSQEKRQEEIVVKLAGALLLGVGLAVYWWLPALVEQKLVSGFTPFRIEDHFPFIKQLIIPSWGYGASVPGIGDGLSFQIGVVNLAVVGVGLGIFIFARKLLKKKILFIVWALLGLFASVFLMNIRTLPIWQLLPFYQFIQFPWRLLFLTTFFSSVLAAIVVHVLPKNMGKIFGILVALGGLVLTVGYFKPSKIVYQSDEYYLARFFEDPTYSEDYLLLPKWVNTRPSGKPASKIEIEEGNVVGINQINPISWNAEVFAPKPSKVTFNAYFFPGWKALVDGQDVKIKPGEPYGQIELEVSGGNHTVEFFWKETTLRRIADFVSLVSLMAIAALFSVPVWRKLKTK